MTIFRRRNIGFIFQNYNLVPILNFRSIVCKMLMLRSSFQGCPPVDRAIVNSKCHRNVLRRRNIGFIFQNYNLVPILNVYENIVLPVELDGDTVDQRFMDEIMSMLALEDKLKNMPKCLEAPFKAVRLLIGLL